MVDESLRRELLSLRADDLDLREAPCRQRTRRFLPFPYGGHSREERRASSRTHRSARPAEHPAGPDAAEAAWLIAQHSIGEREFMRGAFCLVQACAKQGRVPAWHAAYLEDRIALYEGRPQRFGTQGIEDPRDGLPRPWTLADPVRVNDLRALLGLKHLPGIPPPGPDFPAEVRRQTNRSRNGGSIGSLPAAGATFEIRTSLQFCPSGQVVPFAPWA